MPLLPTSLADITLGTWISYIDSLTPLDEQLAVINGLPEGKRKSILLMGNLVKRAYQTYEYFGGTDEPLVDEVLNEYTDSFCKLFENLDLPQTKMPSPELAMSAITFGQFIDAKMLTQGAEGGSKWRLMQYIAAIFCAAELYKPEFVNEGNEVFKSMGVMPMSDVYLLSLWWENTNTYINENYTLFQDSGEKEGANMKEHMRRWGWINFLKSIAKTKVFDIAGSGVNSVDCARAAICDDVLTWASEEKDYNNAMSRDMEDNYRNI